MRINILSTVVMSFILLVSCEKKGDDTGACGAGYAGASGGFAFGDPFSQYTGTVVPRHSYYSYSGGTPNTVTFFSGFNAKAVCVEEHMKISFVVRMRNVSQTLSMRLFGDAYWSAFSDEIILFNGVPTPDQRFTGSLSAGLKQAYPVGAADIDAFVNVEFTSLGSFSLDSAYFVQHVEFTAVDSKYSKF